MPVTLMQAVRAGATLIADAAVVRVIVGPGTRRASGVEAMRPDGSRFLIDAGASSFVPRRSNRSASFGSRPDPIIRAASATIQTCSAGESRIIWP